MAMRHGVVLVFREGVTKQKILEALEKIEDVVDPKYDPRRADQKIETFDAKYGGPVWYVP